MKTILYVAAVVACISNVALAADGNGAAGDWPKWRGPNSDCTTREQGLLDKWPEGGPPLAWKMTGLGQGVAAVVTCKGRLYTLGNKDKTALVQCFDLATQKPAQIKPMRAERFRRRSVYLLACGFKKFQSPKNCRSFL